MMHRRFFPAIAALLNVGLLLPACSLTNETATIYRDEFGVPHIYADSAVSVCYAHGYAQAEDRLEQIFDNYRRALGTRAEIEGPSALRDDYRSRIWKHGEIAKKNYSKLPANIQAMTEAFQAGIKQYMAEHPEKVPANVMELEPWQAIAVGRLVIWGWPEGEAGGDLRRGGIEPDPVDYHGSNEMTLSPSKSKAGVAMAVVDPHLGFYGPMRFYESRLYGGELQFAGISVVGQPIPSLGHSAYCSIAMTTGGPDTADVFEETLNPDNPAQYKFDGKWQDGKLETIKINVKTKDGKIDVVEKPVLFTHHGPVVATKGDKGYAMALSYYDEYELAEQIYKMATAKNIKEMKAALSMCQLMAQNVMVATVDGDIYYQRTGRVPIRPDGVNSQKPIPGDDPANEWQGIHPSSDLVQILNPECGWMQNCNVAPRVMCKNSPMTPEKYKPYIYMDTVASGIRYGNHQRAAQMFDELDAAKDVTIEDWIEITLSINAYGVGPWQARLKAAWEAADSAMKENSDLAAYAKSIIEWNGRVEKDSAGPLHYMVWKSQFSDNVKLYDRLGTPPSKGLSDGEVISTLEKGLAKVMSDHGGLATRYGDVYRAGRLGGKTSVPVDGGSNAAIATPRALGFGPPNEQGQRVMSGGQCATQIVMMTKPPQSWSIAPLGASDDPASPHFDDQALQLVGGRKPKPNYFQNKEELLKHVQSEKALTFQR